VVQKGDWGEGVCIKREPSNLQFLKEKKKKKKEKKKKKKVVWGGGESKFIYTMLKEERKNLDGSHLVPEEEGSSTMLKKATNYSTPYSKERGRSSFSAPWCWEGGKGEEITRDRECQ